MVPNDAETETVVINKPDPRSGPQEVPEAPQRERRFTAPGFDAKETTIISTTPEPATEVFATPGQDGTAQFGPRPKPLSRNRSHPGSAGSCARPGNSTGGGYWRSS